MPIAKKYRAFELVGRRVRSDVALRRGTGEGIDAGGVLNVISAHHNLVLESDVCVHCGQSIRLHGVSRNDVTLLELELETGRKNQIRAHMEYIGHPIIGDKKYGSKRALIGRVALHAGVLSFIHPVTGKRLDFSTPVPRKFLDLFA